jgi:hypothetical protein
MQRKQEKCLKLLAQNDVHSERQGNVFDSLKIQHIFFGKLLPFLYSPIVSCCFFVGG